MVVLNKVDTTDKATIEKAAAFLRHVPYCKKVLFISALTGFKQKEFMRAVLDFLPEGEPFLKAMISVI